KTNEDLPFAKMMEVLKSKSNPDVDDSWSNLIFDKALVVVMAHEFSHILQYKKGMHPEGPWQMEPHADYMAGWCFVRHDHEYRYELFLDPANDTKPVAVMTPATALESAVKSIFDKGDTEFNNKTHHGEPEFRAAMVRAGYDSASLEVDAAFDKGRVMV